MPLAPVVPTRIVPIAPGPAPVVVGGGGADLASIVPCGILLLDKPLGLSSNAALQRVRALLGGVKAGHVGSLDPLATGMLPICLGEATKVAGELGAARKRYRFRVALGTRTASGDAEGEVIERAPVPTLESATVEAALERLRAIGQQIPPMYSALKREGQPLYALARAGVTIERAPRPIELAELRLISLEEGTALRLETLCSKGTYVRVLAEDIAGTLGTVGHVTELRRIYVEPFEHEAMHTLETIATRRAQGEWPALLAPDAALPALPAVHLAAEQARRVLLGQSVMTEPRVSEARVRLYDETGTFFGIGVSEPSGAVHPRRLLRTSP
jgi:tRNA pseudouridine55 synthase